MLVKGPVKWVGVKRGKKKEREREKESNNVETRIQDQLKVSGRCPDSPAESTDKIYPATEKQRLSSCRDLTRVCLQWNSLRSLVAGGEEPAPWLLQPLVGAEQRREGRCRTVSHYLPAAVNRKRAKRRGRSRAEDKYSFFLNIVPFLYISSVSSPAEGNHRVPVTHSSVADVLWVQTCFLKMDDRAVQRGFKPPQRSVSEQRSHVAHTGHRKLCRSGSHYLESAAFQDLMQKGEQGNLAGKVHPC